MAPYGVERHPPSLFSGGCLPAVPAAVAVLDCRLNGESRDGVLLWTIVFTLALGAALGYLVGVTIAGPFLLAEWLKRRREAAQQPPGSPQNGTGTVALARDHLAAPGGRCLRTEPGAFRSLSVAVPSSTPG